MLKQQRQFLFFILLSLLPLSYLQAEPWLSNRYAENCTACHSPARRNLQAKDRRCTLACQGCHVNPNGGGLRNEYGVWNQQRFLRSFKWGFAGSKGTPATEKFQKYGDMPRDMDPSHFTAGGDGGSKSKSKTSGKDSKSKKDKNTADKKRKPQSDDVAKKDWKHWETMAKEGAPLVVTPEVWYDLADHDRWDKQYEITAKSRTEFMARLTEDDPYRLERKKSVFAGGDFRYFYLDGTSKEDGGAERKFKGALFPMALDLGVKVRPTPEHFSVVMEHRYLNGPIPDGAPGSDHQSSYEKIFTGDNSTSQVRSAYLMVDDLPYATYVMYGLYRPMFGHFSPDHTTLLNNIITADNRNAGDPTGAGYAYNQFNAASAKMLHRALTIGGSPNVPFANFHLIMPTDGEKLQTSYRFTQDEGWAMNLGGRFVTLGASFMFSMWSTTGPRVVGGEDLATDMMSISGGITFADFVLNLDFSTVEREYEPGGADKGNVKTVELKYRAWREMYAMLNYASSDVARNLKNGEASEIGLGLKTFLIPGVEFELLFLTKEDRNGDTGASTNTDLTQAQMHLFF